MRLGPKLDDLLCTLAAAATNDDAPSRLPRPFLIKREPDGLTLRHPKLPDQRLVINPNDLDELRRQGIVYIGTGGAMLFVTAQGLDYYAKRPA